MAEYIENDPNQSGPKQVVSTISAKVGGVLSASAPGELTRGERQVINARRSLKFKQSDSNATGVVDEISCKNQRMVSAMSAA